MPCKFTENGTEIRKTVNLSTLTVVSDGRNLEVSVCVERAVSSWQTWLLD